MFEETYWNESNFIVFFLFKRESSAVDRILRFFRDVDCCGIFFLILWATFDWNEFFDVIKWFLPSEIKFKFREVEELKETVHKFGGSNPCDF
jgi:hypothetical protein